MPCFAAGLVITGVDGARHELPPDAFRDLPRIEVTIGDPARNQPHDRPHRFEGPLLWAVLSRAGVIDPTQYRGQVRQYVVLTGRDGYTALLALSEIAPEFEGKPVIVAERMDGGMLGPEHLRIVVPGDKRGGRGVHNLVEIGVTALAK